MKKIIEAIALIADLTPAVAVIGVGVALIVGGQSGALWL
jgi:hypothetical protein